MYLFLSFQHFYKFLNMPGARLWFLSRLNSKENCISICAVQRLKEGFCFPVPIQRGLKIVWNSDISLPFINDARDLDMDRAGVR